VNDEFTLGYDRDFETQWWRIEVCVWVFLVLVLAAGLAGFLGKGPLSHKKVGTADGMLTVDYPRVARYKTPEIMVIRIAPAAYRNGQAYLWLNRAVIEKMGLQRIIPEPIRSMPGEDGIGYLFPVSDPARPTILWLAKEASSPGLSLEEVKLDAGHDLFLRSVALP
jgi:hypothetical protein